MAQNHFLAGVGRALIFSGDNLIGVAKTLTESTFNFSISSEDIRGNRRKNYAKNLKAALRSAKYGDIHNFPE